MVGTLQTCPICGRKSEFVTKALLKRPMHRMLPGTCTNVPRAYHVARD